MRDKWSRDLVMYLTINYTNNKILDGQYPDKIDNYFYPIERNTMLEKIYILIDKSSFLKGLNVRLSKYPKNLSRKLVEYHLDKLADEEDLRRAVFRKDMLFYHFALDIAIDHFLRTYLNSI